jgi:hypothetical protein
LAASRAIPVTIWTSAKAAPAYAQNRSKGSDFRFLMRKITM